MQWPHMSKTDFIDILLVAVIIYELLALIRGTRAAYMLVGVAVLALALYFSSVGELATLNWLLSALLPYTVFALIVIFSAEIRQALARLGRRLLLSRGRAGEGDVYDDIVLAANLFSQNQTGALMVIEREIGLRTYIESGVPLDARLSYDLLATIFRPSAPLHDGAVIVSEETGAISLAVGGKIERDATVEQLRERLGELLRRYVPPSTLPTPITSDNEEMAGAEDGIQRAPLPRAADSRQTAKDER